MKRFAGWSAFLVVCIVGFGMVLNMQAQASQFTIKDIPDAYDDQYDTPGFEAASSGGDTFTVTGNEIVLIENTSAGDSIVSMNSEADNLGRTNDLDDTVPANSIVIVGPMKREGWEDSAGVIDFDYPDGNSDIQIAIMRLKNL